MYYVYIIGYWEGESLEWLNPYFDMAVSHLYWLNTGGTVI
jgi:hypothetical protein